MAKVRISGGPKTGDQLDYSLYTGPNGIAPVTPSRGRVTDTLTAVPRDQANLEAEHGETVVGDVDNDGYVEHMKISGKKHAQGGVPLNLPEGSFIFSDNKKMKIKDPEVLKYFGESGSKPRTPAQIAAKYDVNGYMQDLRNPDSDPIRARSAQKMVDDNMHKLAELSFMQESMKGMPAGVPALAATLVGPGADSASNGQGQYGTGGETGNPFEQGASQAPVETKTARAAPFKAVKGMPFYIGDKRYTVGSVESPLVGEDYIVLADEKGKPASFNGVQEIPVSSFKNFNTNKSADLRRRDSFFDRGQRGMDWHNYHPAYIGSTPQRSSSNAGVTMSGVGTFYKGSHFVIGNDQYEVIDPFAYSDQARAEKGIRVRKKGDDQYSGRVFTGQELKKVQDRFSLTDANGSPVADGWRPAQQAAPAPAPAPAPASANSSNDRAVLVKDYRVMAGEGRPSEYYVPKTTEDSTREEAAQQSREKTTRLSSAPALAPATSAPAAAALKEPIQATAQKKKAAPARTTSAGDDYLNQLALGGEQPDMAVGPEAASGYYKPDQVLYTKKLDDGTYVEHYANKAVLKDKDGKVLREKSGLNSAYGRDGARQVLESLNTPGSPYEVRYSPQAQGFGAYSRQHATNGVYMPSGSQGSFDWNEFQQRHPQVAQYPGGFTKFQADLQSPKAHGEAAGWFQKSVDDLYTTATGKPYFATRDNKFGVETFSAPGLVQRAATLATAPAATAPIGAGAGVGKQNVQQNNSKQDPADTSTVVTPEQAQERAKWWTQNKLQLGNSMLDLFSIRKTNPTLQQVDYQRPDFQPLDPGRSIAAMQGVAATDAAEASASGSAGQANARRLATNGQLMEKVADVVGNYDNQNRQGSAQVSAAAAEGYNQNQMVNTKLRDEFLTRGATANQQFENAMRAARANVLKQYNAGLTNAQMTGAMNSINHQYHVDPVTGQTFFTGVSGDVTGPAAAGPEATSKAAAAQYAKDIQNGLNQGMNQEAAERFAMLNMKRSFGSNATGSDQYYKKATAGANPLANFFAQMMGGGVE